MLVLFLLLVDPVMGNRNLLLLVPLAALLFFAGCEAPADSSLDASAPPSGLGGKADDTVDHDGPPASLVELKLTIDPSSLFEVLRTFEPDRDDLQRRSITFHDTPDLALYEHGVVLRSRKVKGDPDDSTVKIRPILAADAYDLVPEYFGAEGFKCELDWTLTREVSSCSYSIVQGRGEIEEVAAGTRELNRLFSARQERLFEAFAPVGVSMGDMVPLGPVTTIRFRKEIEELDLRITVELWTMPGGGLLIELSTRVEAEYAEDTYVEFQEWAADAGMDLAAVQGTKTGRVLEYFAAQL